MYKQQNNIKILNKYQFSINKLSTKINTKIHCLQYNRLLTKTKKQNIIISYYIRAFTLVSTNISVYFIIRMYFFYFKCSFFKTPNTKLSIL